MSAITPSPATIAWNIQELVRDAVSRGHHAEIVYQDPAGQICVVHEVIRDVLSRAGKDFLVIGKGQVLSADHIVMIDGQRLTKE
ncbi:MAG: hypothetical protein B7X58_05795 [Marinobacter sp. 34-60-7]|nr:MAG: hypothetical protein B7X58_05795 [Marinobacter sp. 34-60-7]